LYGWVGLGCGVLGEGTTLRFVVCGKHLAHKLALDVHLTSAEFVQESKIKQNTKRKNKCSRA